MKTKRTIWYEELMTEFTVENAVNRNPDQCRLYMCCTPLEREKHGEDICYLKGKDAYETCNSPGKKRL